MRRPRHVRPPAHVSAALRAVLGSAVEGVGIVEHSWLTRLHGRAVATTRRQRIYLRGSACEFFANPWLMLHEYCHVLHQWDPGRLSVPRYLLECARHGYWNNRFEVEAREFADRRLPELHAQLKARSPQERLAPVEARGDEGQ